MQELPPGWQVSNNEGSRSVPQKPEESGADDDSSDEGSDAQQQSGLDVEPDSPGWEDVEPNEDVESVNYKCLICEEQFNNAEVMLEHCRSEHSFDFLEIRRLHGLDFYSTIKLVNYIRMAVKNGNAPDLPDLASPAVWSDNTYLKPTLEDDALLYSLGDVVDFSVEVTDEGEAGG